VNAIILTFLVIGLSGGRIERQIQANADGSGLAQISDYPVVYDDTLYIPDSIPVMPGGVVEIPIRLINNLTTVAFRVVILHSSDITVDSIYPSSLVDSVFGDNSFSFIIASDTLVYLQASTQGNPFSDFLPSGDLVLAYIKCTVSASASLGTLYPFSIPDSFPNPASGYYYTTITDTTELFSDKKPVIDDGSLFITYTTTPPVVEDIPDTTINEGQQLIFSVSAYDPDGDSLTLYAENLPPNASFSTVSGDSAVSGTFTFNPDTTQGDSIYRVTFVAEDQYGARGHEDVFIHVLNVVNLPPQFVPLPDTSVKEGDTLVLTVQASDPEGGPVTLSTGALPPNATFTDNGNGTGTFIFTPDFDQGGDTVLVTFYAVDTAGATGSMDVNIEIIDVPYDFLIADTTGGLPGASGIGLPIWVVAQAPIYGLQFDLAYDNNALTVDSVVKRDGYPDFVLYRSEPAPGTLRIVFMSYSLGTLPAGQQAIMDVYFSVEPGASTGQHPVVPFNAIDVIDMYGNWRPMVTFAGYVNVDLLGDVNLDGMVNVADIVLLISYLLGYVDLNPRQLANADANQDDNVNVGDVVAIVGIILQAAPPTGLEDLPVASLYPEEEGNAIDLKLQTFVPVGGIQVELNYDPAKVQVSEPQLPSRFSDFQLSYRNEDGRLIAVIYSLSGDSMPSGDFAFLRLPYSGDPRAIRIERAYVSDPYARMMPLKIGAGGPFAQYAFALKKLAPNPFTDDLQIEFTLPEACPVSLRIYDASGRLVRTILDGRLKVGLHMYSWNGKDSLGRKVGQGVYFIRLITPHGDILKKVVALNKNPKGR